MARRLLRPEVVWPAAVIILILAGMGSAFAVLFFSRSDGGAQVIDAYYSQSLAWDSSAVRRHAVERFGWTVDIEPAGSVDADGRRRVDIRVSDASGDPVEGLVLSVKAFRPQLAAPVDSAVAEASQAPGRYGARLTMRDAGLWDLVVSGDRDGEPFMLRVRRELLH